jgi:hypothetical protein
MSLLKWRRIQTIAYREMEFSQKFDARSLFF